jgi:hypothetical protein
VLKERIDVLDTNEAVEILEQLRTGLPSHHHAQLYSSGNEDFLTKVRKRHLDPTPTAGKIRFISGSWGSGKTHFFRLLTDEAFDAGYVVSTVELSAHESPFNKFELVLFAIIRNISIAGSDKLSASPLGNVLKQTLFGEAGGEEGDLASAVTRLDERLFNDPAIDIDVKRVVRAYWDTFLGETTSAPVLEERRGLLLQWFAGEAHKPTFRKEFGVQKVVGKENARVVLGSLVALVQMIGFKGLLILFDESEMTHSTMSKSNLKQAHNNLLHLLNEVGEVPGLLLLYAAVPEFFNDPTKGIRIYGALAARIGDPPSHPPRALDKVWNLDAIETVDSTFADTAISIRAIYGRAYPEEQDALLTEADLRDRISLIVSEHGPYQATSRWRVVIKETTKLLDMSIEGEDLPDPGSSYRETVSLLEQMGDD